MKIRFDQKTLEHISELSFYNHNYYKLPYSIDGCEVVYIEWIDDSFEGDYTLGNFNSDGDFEPKHLFYGDMDGNVDLVNNKQSI
jgi:hypothetical protein